MKMTVERARFLGNARCVRRTIGLIVGAAIGALGLLGCGGAIDPRSYDIEPTTDGDDGHANRVDAGAARVDAGPPVASRPVTDASVEPDGAPKTRSPDRSLTPCRAPTMPGHRIALPTTLGERSATERALLLALVIGR